jgi:hypothetical protein
MSKFKGVPPTPVGDGIPFGLNQFMESLRNNVEVLTRQGVLKGGVTINPPKTPEVQSLSYEGLAYTIEDAQVPAFSDVVKLAQDVQKLASDVYYIMQYLDVLVKQLKD